MPLSLSPSAQRFEESPTLAINERVRRLTAEGRTVYQMGFGESRFPVHPKILDALREHATARSYTPVAGFPELRSAIAGFYTREFRLATTPEQVIVGVGSKSLLFALVRALEGDVLLPRPSWVSYAPQALVADRRVTWIDTRAEDEYCLTADGLAAGLVQARKAGQQPQILILNSPGNPTGVVYPAGTIEELAEVARYNDIAVISDEIYALINHFDSAQCRHCERPHVSIATYYPEGAFVTGGLSKHHSLGGWRFGLTVVPAGEAGTRVMQALTAIAGAVWSSPAAPVQHAATVAYSDDSDIAAYVQTCSAIHAAVTQELYTHLVGAGIPCPRPSGAYYLYPNFNEWAEALRRRYNVATSDDLAALLLDEYGIATLPGTAFGARAGDLSLRLSTSYLSAQDDAHAVAVLAAYAEAPGTVEFVRSACPDVLEVGRRLRMFVERLSD
ncbi:MAG: pyridoxal phosphate-dependent aminotransferase [Anaerolineae bacterium]